jgi:hypothetical protein
MGCSLAKQDDSTRAPAKTIASVGSCAKFSSKALPEFRAAFRSFWPDRGLLIFQTLPLLRTFLLFIFLLLGLFLEGGSAQSARGLPLIPQSASRDPLQVRAQSYTLDPETGIARYKNASLTWQSIVIDGTEVLYDTRQQLIRAEGYVRVSEGTVTAVMERLELRLQDGSAEFQGATIFDSRNRAYLTAEIVQRLGESHYLALNCSFTTCNPRTPAWEIRGSRIDYFSENFSSSLGSSLRVGGVPVFYFPYLAWPTVTRRQSGFLPPEYSITRSSLPKFDLGYRIGLPYFWALDDEHDLTVTYDWVERRGPGWKLDYQYAFREGMRGEVRSQRFWERDPRDPEQEAGSLSAEEAAESNLHPSRFKYSFNHNQSFGPATRLIASGLVYSDSQFQKEYELIDEPNPNYAQKLTLSLSQQFAEGNVALSATQDRVYQGNEIAVLNNAVDRSRVQSLPSVSFRWSETAWRSQNTTLNYALSGSHTRFYREEGLNGLGTVLNPELRLRSTLGVVGVSLGVAKQVSNYRVWSIDTGETSGEYDFNVSLADIALDTVISRTFALDNDLYSRAKHRVTPQLQYEYIEDVSQNFQNELPPFGGTLRTRRLATLRVENLLLVKRRVYEPTLKVSFATLNRLRKEGLDELLLQRLERLKGREFLSESDLESALARLPGSPDPEVVETILALAERGAPQRTPGVGRRSESEGKAEIWGRLTFSQPYDFLRIHPDFDPVGPTPLGNETEVGQPLLPLKTELSVFPVSGVSVNYLNRYHHQRHRVVEYALGVQVGLSTNNRASVSFRENEVPYTTPYGAEYAATKTFGFSNSHELHEALSAGISGSFDLTPESAFKRRLTENSLFLKYTPDCWNITLRLQEQAATTLTSSGQEVEYVERAIYANIDLGGISLPEQTFPGWSE